VFPKFRHDSSSEFKFELEINQYFCNRENFVKQIETNRETFEAKKVHLKAKSVHFETKNVHF